MAPGFVFPYPKFSTTKLVYLFQVCAYPLYLKEIQERFMPKTQVSCPNCRQPVIAEIEQVFDTGIDPTAKQKLISGAYNIIECPRCGYIGNLSTPIVYHDPQKELLLTFVPAELGLPRNDQERILGGLLKQVTSNLPKEKFKAYLLQPQSTLTMQGLIERILQEDGITREMIQAQQQKLSLIQRLLSASGETRNEIARQEDKLIDAEFFTLLSRIGETALANGDQNGARAIAELQQSLLPVTTFGKVIQEQSKEIEAAVASLQEAGEGLTREKLLEIVINAPNETRLQALVSLARPGMDYQFFQLLSERIDRARGDGRTRLIQIRDTLLELTREIDQQAQLRQQVARQLLDEVLRSPDPVQALEQNLPEVDNYFLQELNSAIQAARQAGDLEKIAKLQKLIDLIQSMSAAPPEVELIEALLDANDEQARRKLLEENRAQITPEFLDALTSIVSRVESNQDKELTERIRTIHREALRYSMELNLGS
jgi:hypothetical protein